MINDCYSKINKHICSNSSHAINDKSINLLVISSVFFQFFFFCSYSLFVLFLHIFFLQVAFYEIFITSPYKKWKTNRWLWIVFFFFQPVSCLKNKTKNYPFILIWEVFFFFQQLFRLSCVVGLNFENVLVKWRTVTENHFVMTIQAALLCFHSLFLIFRRICTFFFVLQKMFCFWMFSRNFSRKDQFCCCFFWRKTTFLPVATQSCVRFYFPCKFHFSLNSYFHN